MRPECYFCHIKTLQVLINKYQPTDDMAERLIFSACELLSENRTKGNPVIATGIHKIARQLFNATDLYAEEKKDANETLMNKYTYWKEYIQQSDDPFYAAAKLAVIGNIIDYGAHSVSDDIVSQINALYSKNITLDNTIELKNAVRNAKSILYLGDNAGEIVFDRLFIETMDHPNITFAVRGMHIINDITTEDAKEVGIDKMCRVISNGSDAPSTILEFCSEEFKESYRQADLIISKGQGNFEGLMNEDHPNTYFLLIAKCDPIARLLKVNKNDMVVMKSDHRYAL